MTGPIVTFSGVPTGGAVLFNMPEYVVPGSPPSGVTFLSMARAVSGASGLGAFTTFYSGAVMPAYIDAGDGLPTPLLSGSAYVYNVTDDRGTTQVGPITPAATINARLDYLTNLFIRLIQAGVSNLTPPAGIPTNIVVTTKMPEQGLAALPYIVVNLDLIQQSELGIGQDTPYLNLNNEQILWTNAERWFRISLFAANPETRDYYRDSLIILFMVLKATVFSQLGYDVTHRFQANSYTDPKEWEGHSPGFYGADLMLKLDGVFQVSILTNYSLVETITVDVNAVPYSGTITVGTSP